MAFLKEGSKFPPEEWEYWYNKYYEYSAWYSGDPEELLNYYSRYYYYADSMESKFWYKIQREERANIVHLPAAGDVAGVSANLLFSESPKFKYDETIAGGDRIKTFIKENGLLNVLLEGAEISAALSGCFLKLDVEPELVKIPIVSIITPTQCFPTFWRGRLWEILFYKVVKEENGGATVWRLFENRKRASGYLDIEYKLYRGTTDRIGREHELNSIDETVNLNLEDTRIKMEGLGCVYVPNMRPNKLRPNSNLGINDFSGCISLLDSLDFTWTSWMRDIELGMGQILVDEELLNRDEALTSGEQMYFSKFQKAIVKLNLSPWRMGGENVKPIDNIQFDIRVEEHSKTCQELFTNIISLCGYSPQSFGIIEQGTRAESGTALRIRERKSLLTREKKSRYWQPALWDLFWQMQQMDQATNLSRNYDVQEVDVELEDSIIVDPREQSETLRNLDTAKTVSLYTKIKMLHPEWEDSDIEEEIDRIKEDEPKISPPTFFEEEFEEEGEEL